MCGGGWCGVGRTLVVHEVGALQVGHKQRQKGREGGGQVSMRTQEPPLVTRRSNPQTAADVSTYSISSHLAPSQSQSRLCLCALTLSVYVSSSLGPPTIAPYSTWYDAWFAHSQLPDTHTHTATITTTKRLHTMLLARFCDPPL
jgi:hypothetical protein